MKVTVTGGTGFVGRQLVTRLLEREHEVRILARSARTGVARDIEVFLWDAAKGEPPQESLEDTDAVVHLAGESVAQRWSPAIKSRIRNSRVEGTRRLVDGLARLTVRPAVLVAASAIGFYGDRGEEELTETSKAGAGFLPEVCQEWEAAADLAAGLGIRVVKLRLGVVLGAGGGALEQMLPPFRMFLGGQLGSGRQWMSWIHMDDVTGLIQFALEKPELSGVVNATAPSPVRNSQFTRLLGRTIRRPALFTVPKQGLRLLFGEMSEMMLGSQKVIPAVARKAGYPFAFTDLGQALKSLLG